MNGSGSLPGGRRYAPSFATHWIAGALAASALALVGCPGPPTRTTPTTIGGCAVRPGCEFERVGPLPATPAGQPPDVFNQLGCVDVYKYANGTLGNGTGTFCPDTPLTRQSLHAARPELLGYLPGYCEAPASALPPMQQPIDPTRPTKAATASPEPTAEATSEPPETCISVPAGKIFVFITKEKVRPSCPSTCYPAGNPL